MTIPYPISVLLNGLRAANFSSFIVPGLLRICGRRLEIVWKR